MGTGLAQIAVLNGHPVRLVDTDPAALDRARQQIGQAVAGMAAKKGLAGDQLSAPSTASSPA